MTKNYDQTEKVTCPHCKKQLQVGLNFEMDFENETTGVQGTIEVIEDE